MLGESPLEIPRASMHIPGARALVLTLALRLASAVPLLWFLYWICYGIVVWNWPPFLLNCVGAILSVLIIVAVSRLTLVKDMLDNPEKKENEELANVSEPGSFEEQGNAEKKDNTVGESNEHAEPMPVLQELKTDENSKMEQKQESVAILRERLQLERKEGFEIEMRRDLQTLKDELTRLQHQREELMASLKAPQ